PAPSDLHPLSLHDALPIFCAFVDRHATLVAVARRRSNGLETPGYQWMRQSLRAWLRQAELGGELREGADIEYLADALLAPLTPEDRKSTRLKSSRDQISYA